MASGQPGEAARQINRLFRDGTAAALTDGQLLERFATRRPGAAESAFEALVSRHGPMVLRVCRGVLRDPHDVEDAFQATFLVLVRKANAIGERDLLGPWLYGVAHRVARKARGVAARRNQREGGLMDDPPADATEGAWLDLRPILHEELNRLPEKYRKPVVLCHLQGLTHSEAAQELAWPVGTVSVRLTRARKLLKERLTRRGLTATATLWAAGLTLEGASAAVPESLLQSTAKAALAFGAGQTLAAGMASAGSITLAKRTLTMMFLSRLTWFAAPLLLGAGTLEAVNLARTMPDDPAPQARKDVVPKPPTNDGPALPSIVGRSPFDLDTAAPKPEVKRIEAVSPVVLGADGKLRIDPVPPGYFSAPAGDGKPGSGPAPVKVGQVLQVEVLEALPGRPITGEMLVRPDGTISLGFYGDLEVAGLNRHQITLKALEHLRKYLGDETLGLVKVGEDGKVRINPKPLESARIFVADDVQLPRNYGSNPGGAKAGQVVTVEALQALPGRPITGERVVGPDGTINLGFYGDVPVLGLDRAQIKVKVIEHLRKYLNDEPLGLIETDRSGDRRVVPAAESSRVFIDDAILPSEPRTSEAVRQLRGQVKDLNIKLERALKEIEDLRKAVGPAGAR